MKLHSFLYEILIFSLIFAFCVLPPCFIMPSEDAFIFSEPVFPWKALCLFVFTVIFYILILQKRIQLSYYTLISFAFCFSLLFFNSLIMKAISILVPNNSDGGNTEIVKPQNAVQWLFIILNFLFASAYEEVIYRAYFPDALISLLKRIHKVQENKILRIILVILAEIIALSAFSFAHFYLGVLSVINAAVAHIILRLFYRKRQDIISVWAAHFFYNIISLILL